MPEWAGTGRDDKRKAPAGDRGDLRRWGFYLREGTQQYSDATRPPDYNLFRVRPYAAAANRMFGDPTTPLFSNVAFISLEPNQVRAFATSATSWRITTSFGSLAL